MLPDLTQRDRQPELMDQPGLERSLHRQALGALIRVNRVTGTAAGLWPRIRALGNGSAPLRVLDLGCGAGELTLGLLRRARREGLPLEAAGCDVSAIALALAAERAQREGLAARFFHRDVVHEDLPEGWDVLVSSFFLHHFDEGPAVELLRRMSAAAHRGIVVDDLVRSRAGYLYVQLGGRLLTRSPVFRVDAPLSVRAAFTPAEVESLAERAGLDGARVERRWPERFVLTWSRR